MSENRTELMMYQTEDGQTKIDVRMENETVWLSLDQMAELFQRDKSTISRHIRNIFAEGELDREAVVAKFATTASDGKTYQVDFYNLDVIISVGYRVRSLRGTQFRIWANSVLKEYLIKGFAIILFLLDISLLEVVAMTGDSNSIRIVLLIVESSAIFILFLPFLMGYLVNSCSSYSITPFIKRCFLTQREPLNKFFH